MFESTDNLSLSFERICRACLQYSNDMNYLFEGTLMEMFTSCSSVEISEDDMLPTFICVQCLNQLNKSFNFKQLCIQSDQILKANIEHRYLPTQIYENINRESSMDFQSSNLLEAEVIFANLPEDDTSRVAQKNAESILQFAAQSDEDDQVYLENIDLEPECNLVDSEVVNAEIIWADSQDMGVPEDSNSASNNVIEVPLETVKCEKCKVQFPNNDDLSVHMSIHQEDKIQCLKCLKKFPKMGKLKRHVKTHFSIKSHHCDICGKQFSESGGLAKHKERHRSMSAKQFICSECGVSYNLRCSLTKHIKKKHSNEPKTNKKTDNIEGPFTCNVCHKSFKYASNLTDHMKLHTGRKPYKCDLCGKEFAQVSNFRLHLRYHAGSRPHMCSKCGRGFASSSKRNDHFIALHSQRKLLHCDQCGKSFLRPSGLELHKKLHNGDLQHPCPLCPKRFVSTNVRNRHMEIHSKVKIFSCNICSEVFDRAGALGKHKKIHILPKKSKSDSKTTGDPSSFFNAVDCPNFASFSEWHFLDNTDILSIS